MQSDKPGTARGYLHDVLVDGRKPFRYRGRVRSLLGIPDGESNNLAFAPALPPVGFRYADFESRGEAYWVTQHPLPEATHPALGRGAWAEPVPQDVTGEKYLTQDTAQPRGPGPEPRPEQVTVEPGGTPEGAGAAIEQVGLEIPGVSKREQSFPALSPAETDRALLDQRGNRFRQGVAPVDLLKDSKTETPGAPEASQHNAPERQPAQNELAIRDTARPPDVAPALKQNPVPVEPVEKPTLSDTAIEQARLEVPGVSKREQSFPALSPAKTGHAPANRTENRSRHRVSATRSRGRSGGTSQAGADEGQPAQDESQARSPVMERREVREHLALPQKGVPVTAAAPDTESVLEGSPKPERVKQRLSPTPVPVGPDQAPDVQSVRPAIVNRSNVEAAETIEQLRHAVHQLTAKVASPPGQTDQSTRPQPPAQRPLPPTQPAVIIQRTFTRARIPRAFWERRYLSRFHLRTLR